MPASRAAFALIRLFSAAVLCLVASHTQADERFLTQAPAVAKSYSLDGAADKQPSADREAFQVPPGFQVERLYDVPKGRLGSWVSITFDDQGRLLACDQDGGGLSRITPAPIGGQEPTKVEKLAVPITSAQGMVCVQGALYLSVNGGPGSGLYRVKDSDGDDQYDEVKKLMDLAGGGEHGPHGLRLAPDGQSLYLICGNHTDPPQGITGSRLPRNWSEDHLLPRQWDANGHAAGRLAPGGFIMKTDFEGQSREIVSIGYRNSYDFDFNAEGEMFAYDSDMEWDMGTPWYRPTRFTHATSGSEFGWRSGTGKWPAYYIDSLPPVLEIGPGSPTGVSFGTGAKFPAKYQRALYLTDWTFGTIYAMHLTPEGASYRADKEEFVAREGLPLTDVEIGPDGAMYFTVGGRGTQSALYRVTYVGQEATTPVDGRDAAEADLRQFRRQLEAYHGRQDATAVDVVWPALGHADRHIRYAARVALEFQDVARWQDRALAETNVAASLTALVALAHQGKPELLGRVLESLGRIDYAKQPESFRLDLLRAYSLAFIRLGRPDQAAADRIVAALDSHFPATSDAENRELTNVLVYLNSPTVIGKCLALMEQSETAQGDISPELLARNSGYGGTIARILANRPEIQKIHYAFALRNMRFGWTIDERNRYFAWLGQAQKRSGGNSYAGFLRNIQKDALAKMSPAEAAALQAAPEAPPKLADLPKPQGPGKAWTLEEVEQLAGGSLAGRNFENGKTTFAAAQCSVCHRFDGAGGTTGPDLTNVAGRFTIKDLTDAITSPSRVISDQYRATTITTQDGRQINGRIQTDEGGKLTLLVDPFDATKVVELARTEIEEMRPTATSLMPDKLLHPLNQNEVLDLLAYLLSRGNPEDRMFSK